jgi:hypothetical protein
MEFKDDATQMCGGGYLPTLVSEAGTDSKLTALVYVAARAPDAGEDLALSKKFRPGCQ